MSMNPLEPIREEIDKLDQQLIELLAQRGRQHGTANPQR